MEIQKNENYGNTLNNNYRVIELALPDIRNYKATVTKTLW